MIDAVREACRRHDLLRGTLAVAVSGGVDSVVLLHVLLELGHRPVVLGLDHGLRPESSDELAFVEELAGQLELDLRSTRLDLAAGADLAARARTARLGWLAAQGFDSVALGHHRDDQAELVLDRLARGAGAGGLAGMAWRRGVFVRPLLGQPRAELVAFAEARGLRWVEDPSNRLGTRGGLRHEVLPALERVRPGAAGAIVRSARRLAEDERYLAARAGELRSDHGVDPDGPPVLVRRALLALVREVAGGLVGLEARHLDAALALGPGGVVQLPGQLRLLRLERYLVLPAVPPPAEGCSLRWGAWQLESSRAVRVRPAGVGELWEGRPLRERLRAAGVPAALRDLHPVVQLDDRIWVPGLPAVRKPPAGARVEATRPTTPCVPGTAVFRWSAS